MRSVVAVGDAVVSAALAAFGVWMLVAKHSRTFDAGQATAATFDAYVVLTVGAIGVALYSLRESWRLARGRANAAGWAVGLACVAMVIAAFAEVIAYSS
jgi:hypothetical protein